MPGSARSLNCPCGAAPAENRHETIALLRRFAAMLAKFALSAIFPDDRRELPSSIGVQAGVGYHPVLALKVGSGMQ